MRFARGLTALAGLALLAAAVPACYAPDVASGSLRCGKAMSCPAGYSCNAADNTCWKNGETPATDKLGGGLESFLGHWLFTKQASTSASCTDGSRESKTLEDDYMDVTDGGKGDLSASYYCDWDLNVAANGETATIVPGTSCQTTAQMPTTHAVVTTYNWSSSLFTFVKTGASNAVLHAALSATFQKSLMCNAAGTCVPCTANCTGTCTAEISGPLVKGAAP